MIDTQQQSQLQDALSQAVIDAAVSTEDPSSAVPKNGASKEKRVVSPLTGAEMPAGRRKGAQNRVTRTIREAVEKAARDCHADGLAGWLVERAQGSLGDRQIFAAMVNKAMPLQVQAQVDGGVQIQLSWLGQRQIGTTVAQVAEQRTQVLDLKAETDGTYRIIDPTPAPTGGEAPAAAGGQEPVGGADAP